MSKAPIAAEAVQRVDALFEIEREIAGQTRDQRLAVRRERALPLAMDLRSWMRDQRARVSAKSAIAKALDITMKNGRTLGQSGRFAQLEPGRPHLRDSRGETRLRYW